MLGYTAAGVSPQSKYQVEAAQGAQRTVKYDALKYSVQNVNKNFFSFVLCHLINDTKQTEKNLEKHDTR